MTVKRVTRVVDGKKVVGYQTPTGRKVHYGKGAKERAEAFSERGQKAALTRRLRKLIGDE